MRVDVLRRLPEVSVHSLLVLVRFVLCGVESTVLGLRVGRLLLVNGVLCSLVSTLLHPVVLVGPRDSVLSPTSRTRWPRSTRVVGN
jgi:hypothetical protein